MEVRSVTGDLVFFNSNVFNAQMQLDTESLANGAYMVTIGNGSVRLQQELMVMHCRMGCQLERCVNSLVAPLLHNTEPEVWVQCDPANSNGQQRYPSHSDTF